MLIKSKANISKGKATLCWVKALKKQSYNNIAKKKYYSSPSIILGSRCFK